MLLLRLEDQEFAVGFLALGAVWISLCPLFCWVPLNSHTKILAVYGRKSRGVIWSEGRRDVWFVCARERQTDRQTG